MTYPVLPRPCRGIMLLAAFCASTLSTGRTVCAQTGLTTGILVTANETRLWLARPEPPGYAVYCRLPGGPLTRTASFYAPIALLAPVGDELYLFQSDGSFYRYSAAGPAESAWAPEVNLPGQTVPLALTAIGATPYALVASSIAAQLPAMPTGPEGVATASASADAALSLVCYRSRRWWAIGTCPAAVGAKWSSAQAPRLTAFNEKLWVFWSAEDEVFWQEYDPKSGQWLPAGRLAVPGLVTFWTPVVNRVLTLVARTRAGQHEAIQIYCHTGNSDQLENGGWVETQVTFSAAPAGTSPTQLAEAFGFNQHLGLLYTGPAFAFMVFGRFGGPPAMSTVDLLRPPTTSVPSAPVQTVWLGLLLLILAGIFAFRRRNLVTPAVLPPELGIAFTMQRLAGCVVDLVPVSLLTALVLRIGWVEAWAQLGSWAIDPRMTRFSLPERPILVWWLLTVGTYTAYCAVMELAASRTFGKMLVGTKVTTRDGRRPAAWQVLLRNLLRLIELMPPFWILGFLVVLSQNRQRTGDVFANTLVVRRAARPGGTERESESGN